MWILVVLIWCTAPMDGLGRGVREVAYIKRESAPIEGSSLRIAICRYGRLPTDFGGGIG